MVINRRAKLAIVLILIVFGALISFNVVRDVLRERFFKNFNAFPTTISTVEVKAQDWQGTLTAIGSLQAVNGVDVSPEVSGMVIGIYFESGQVVQKGQSLVQLDDSTDVQDLANYQATLNLDKLDYDRKSVLYKKNAVSKSDLDDAREHLQSSQAMVNKAIAIINKKNIRAPFAGKLGIRKVNLGQYVGPGDPLVNLQSLNPLYVNFSLPQQYLHQLSVGQTISINVDAYPGQLFYGKITAVDASVTVATRSIQVQATIPNDNLKLYPGSFADVIVYLPIKSQVVVLPQTAVSYSMYGDIVYVVKDGKAYQRVVKLGESKGDQVVVESGLKAGEQVVNSGQLKLSEGQTVSVDNSVKLQPLKQDQLYGN